MQECKNYLEAGIVRQLENNGLKGGEKEQQVKLVLTYAYMAVSLYREMSPEDRVLVSQWHKKFTRFYSLKNFLKERQRSSRKKSFPPAPPYLDKEVQDKDEIPSLSPARVRKTLQVRQEMFWNELLTFEGEYDRQMYFPNSSSKRSALRKLQHWISINPRLSVLIGNSGNYFTPKEVQQIVDEVGEPF